MILCVVLVACFCLNVCISEESEWMNILFLGDDTRDRTDYGRTDTMIIVSVNRDSGELKMTSIMRDTYVPFNKWMENRINAANMYGGPEFAMQVINDNFGLDMTDYIYVNMNDMVTLVDMIGGIDIELTQKEVEYVNQYARSYQREFGRYDGERKLESAGLCHLNGLLALSYARNRYSDSDWVRVMRQQKVLIAIAEKMQNMEIDELMSLTEEILSLVVTNLDSEMIKDLTYTVMAMELEEVEQFRIPADGAFYSGMYDGRWLIKPWFKENKELLHEFIYGE